MYKHLAPYYDQLFSGYGRISGAAREQLLRSVMPRVAAVCDLCCGTGTTAIEFAQRGKKVWAVDVSPGMLRAARANIRKARVPVRVMQADMREFQLPEKVDLITCEFDALNHVPQKADLPSVLASVARNLNPGGWFFFDVNNRGAFAAVWPLTNFIERPGVAVVFHGGYDPARDPDRAWTDMEFFIKKGAAWRRYHDRVEEVCWSLEEMQDALREAGFSQVRVWDAKPFFGDHPYIRRTHRSIYLARL